MNQRDRLIDLIIKSVDGCARNWAETIADYLLANSVIVPPCKVGDKVYRINRSYYTKMKRIQETKITRIAVEENNVYVFCECCPCSKSIFGEIVFFTREEAERALEAKQ